LPLVRIKNWKKKFLDYNKLIKMDHHVEEAAKSFYKSMKGIGTDEKRLIKGKTNFCFL
jgi:hypothetical protein